MSELIGGTTNIATSAAAKGPGLEGASWDQKDSLPCLYLPWLSICSSYDAARAYLKFRFSFPNTET